MKSFHKSKRLLNKNEYDYVFSQACKLVSAEFVFLYRSNTKNYARLGLAISKKMVSKAHTRNYIKRILRESFRVSDLPAVDVIVLARRNIVYRKKSTLFSNTSKTWNKLLTLCEK